jgi:hypothetical protein
MVTIGNSCICYYTPEISYNKGEAKEDDYPDGLERRCTMSIASATSAFPWQQLASKQITNKQRQAASMIELSRRAVWELGGDRRWGFITCHRGEVWITQTGDVQDYLLKAGEVFLITLPGLVLIQALEDAAVEVTPPRKSRPYRGQQLFFA